jgi:uncharacterized membrane protein
MTGLLGIILIIVGIVHIDDASAGHQRLALAALIAGGFCIVAAVVEYALKLNAMKNGVKFNDDEDDV